MRTLFVFVAFCAAAPAAEPVFRAHTIATDLKGGYQVLAVDLNHDGKLDLLALASGMTDLVWFENPGWTRHVLYSGLRRMINAAALDTDGDGIPELLVASDFENVAARSLGIVTLLRHGPDVNTPWSAMEIDRLPTSHRLRVANGVFVNAPLTGATSEPPDFREHVPLVFYRPGDWQRRLITDADSGVMHGIFVVNWDGKPGDEILTASFNGIHLLTQSPTGIWKREKIAGGHPGDWPKCGASDVAVGQLVRERFLCSIEPWHGNEAVVYHKRGTTWRRTVLDDGLADGHTIVAADFDGDGRDEIIAAGRAGDRAVRLFQERAGQWHKSVIDTGIATASCAAADLNADGRLDLACIGSATSDLRWYENTTPAAARH